MSFQFPVFYFISMYAEYIFYNHLLPKVEFFGHHDSKHSQMLNIINILIIFRKNMIFQSNCVNNIIGVNIW